MILIKKIITSLSTSLSTSLVKLSPRSPRIEVLFIGSLHTAAVLMSALDLCSRTRLSGGQVDRIGHVDRIDVDPFGDPLGDPFKRW